MLCGRGTANVISDESNIMIGTGTFHLQEKRRDGGKSFAIRVIVHDKGKMYGCVKRTKKYIEER